MLTAILTLTKRTDLQAYLPSLEEIQNEFASAKSINDFSGKDGIFARLFADTLEAMLDAELSEYLGYERYKATGRNSGNSRNGKRSKKLRTSGGDGVIQVPHDCNGEYQPRLLQKHQANSNEIKAAFPTPEAVRKLLYLATQDLSKKWGPEGAPPIQNWANILNQLVIRFTGGLPH